MLKVTHSHAFHLSLYTLGGGHTIICCCCCSGCFSWARTRKYILALLCIYKYLLPFFLFIFFLKCIFMGLLVFAWQCLGCCLLIFMASFFIFHSSCNKASKRSAYVYINLTFSYFLLSFWHKKKVIEVQLLLLCAYKSWNCRFLVATVSVIM